MEWSKDWFQIVITVLGLAMFIYWKFFDRNNDVFKILIQNLKETVDRIEKGFKEERKEIKVEIKQNATDITALTLTFADIGKQWDKMSDEYRGEKRELKKRNDLLERQNDLLESDINNKEKMIKYQETEFKTTIREITENTYRVLMEHTNYDRKTSKA